jgi:predicted house-cleaning NTP pyrophosphatase (Maf/HAM1 superfamily)
MPYRGGCALNICTTFSKASGAFSLATLGAALVRSVVGDTSQFIPKTIAQVVESLKQTGALVTLVEAYP